MSIAGLRSNRGDIYQTLVAIGWALTVLDDPQFEWLEIDSTNYDVDDVVIGKSDGSIICCQCKKNQPDFRAWSLSDLSDEIEKAAKTLANFPNISIRFYSRGEFGDIAKLREFAILFSSEEEYLADLTKEHRTTDNLLNKVIAKAVSNFSTYEFLIRTTFHIDHDNDQIARLLRERLRRIVTNENAAFDVLWKHIDLLGGHISGSNLSASPKFRLTKDDLIEVIQQSGSVITPPMAVIDLLTSFTKTSSIGRNWQRDIAGQRIQNKAVSELLNAIDDKKRAILLTGLPGSGKTCVMLSLQEALENRFQTQSDLISLFIQSREFADFESAEERQAQGLSSQWVEQVARLAEHKYVVVVIDSLDVLSIAREHSVLTYFLAQIDKLLLIPNLSVVTACRDFDRRYDHRIAIRKWDCELKCQPLDWETEVIPLLNSLSIDSSSIDTTTRALIQNPRELALYIELAQRDGSFNVVTSQALAKRYLEAIVQTDTSLADVALQAIEHMASVMLQSRSLSIPIQQLNASSDVLRKLRSLNVIQDTHDGRITFGHQTLLDVLVISGAIRQGVTLNQFIQSLPPVPFVRPSVRSFVAQLATGERSEFRKQLRTVLTGSAAFHIRRLVAESFAQLVPQDEDWPLLRDLRKNHLEIFQVIYQQASLVEWHYFWLKYLVPSLRMSQDVDGLTRHVYRVDQWKNEDPNGVLALWMEALSINWLNTNNIAGQLEMYLVGISNEHLLLATPLLKRLLEMPNSDHGFLGAAIARFVVAGAIDDTVLWQYMTGEIDEELVFQYHLGDKLRCQPHEFGSQQEHFLGERMTQSTTLLDLAVSKVEQWNEIRSSRFGETRIGFREGFLRETSYNDAHTQIDHRHIDNERMLFDAMEIAIIHHANNHSSWWQLNRERLCLNHEGALCYLGILALTKHPQPNLDLIGSLLCNRNLLEFSLSYEIALLIKFAFIYLDATVQDAVMLTMLNLWHEPDEELDANSRFWALKKRAVYISAIPCYLRSEDAQSILAEYEETNGKLILLPEIGMRDGTVCAPFSYEIFLNASDVGVLGLLAHYTGYGDVWSDHLVGGEREVGWQLREASSRQPSRFLQLLSTNWCKISADFCDEIMDGLATYLAHRYGNLGTNGTWIPLEEPNGAELANEILNELERHPAHWVNNRSAAKALEATSYVINDIENATRLAFLAIGFSTHTEKSTVIGDSVDLITTGINMKSGNVADALMIVATNLSKAQMPLPVLLQQVLFRFAKHNNPAIRAVILRRLPYFQSHNPNLGWELFDLAMQSSEGLWRLAEPCLYYTYHNDFQKVSPWLERILREGTTQDMETWGRISSLATLTGHIELPTLLTDLNTLNVSDAWEGAASVWSHSGNFKQHREQCITGIEAGFDADPINALAIANQFEHIFNDHQLIEIPVKLIQRCFNIFESDEKNKRHRLYRFSEWLNAISQYDIDTALTLAEIYLAYIKKTNHYFYDHDNRLMQFMTRLFGEAEEREESDQGTMLNRVVMLQDALLAIGVNSVNDWLQSAERMQ